MESYEKCAIKYLLVLTDQASLAVIIPSYNEPSDILVLIKKLIEFKFIKKVIIIDDSDTMKHLNEYKNNTKVLAIHRNFKGGRGSAIIKGFKLAPNENTSHFLEMDADFSHCPQEIPHLFSTCIQLETDLMIASRYLDKSTITNWPQTRKIFSRFSNALAKFLLKVPLRDYTNGFRLYSRAAVQELTNKNFKLKGTGFIALSQILVVLYAGGFKIREIPTHFKNRVRGESSLNLKEIKNAATGLLKIYILKQQLMKKSK